MKQQKTFHKVFEARALIEKYDRILLPLMFVRSIFDSVSPYFNTFMTGLIIDRLLEKRMPKDIVLLAAVMVFINAGVALLRLGLNSVINRRLFLLQSHYQKDKTRAYMDVSYSKLETVGFTDLRQNVRYSDDNMGTFPAIANQFASFFSNAMTLFFAGVILVLMFIGGTMRNTLYLLYAALAAIGIAFLTILSMKFTKFLQMRTASKLPGFFEKMTGENRMAMYLAAHIVYDYNMGKDIRLYGVEPIITQEFDSMMRRQGRIYEKICLYSDMPTTISNAASGFIGSVIYIILAVFAVLGQISVGNVLVFANSIQSLIYSLSSFSLCTGQFSVLLDRLGPTRKLFELADCIGSEEQSKADEMEETSLVPEEIRFEAVSFRYPDCETWVLQNVSFTIKSGEKVSIVGQNGAGKSTAVKLLCKLYSPRQGRILINGIDIWTIPDSQYNRIVAAVFQNFRLFSFSLGENLALSDVYDKQQAETVLKKVGFYERLEKMPKGLDTVLFHDYDEDGAELSGGEAQKIALARCLYTSAPILVLDEPASALDAQTEAEVYEKFNEASEGKMTIFISHRLSACRFCDRILVFEDGRLVQNGTHGELVGQKDSVYERMWNAQAQYYQ